MKYIRLLQQRTKSINFNTDFSPIDEKQNLQIKFHFNLDVAYADDKKHCKATIEQVVEAVENPQALNIKVVVEGILEADSISTKEDQRAAHVQSYYAIFPYVQSLIAQLTVSAGFPALMIQPAILESNDISLSSELEN